MLSMVKRQSKTMSGASGILGKHPDSDHIIGQVFSHEDGITVGGTPHRALSRVKGADELTITWLRDRLINHHTSPVSLEKTKAVVEAIRRLGIDDPESYLKRFPASLITQKGNLAEVVLAEYIVATKGAIVPIYRLKYNPNVDQSMKGDDVLAFDLDANSVRVIVGEAKFRKTATKPAVVDIVNGLIRSYKGGIPASLQFVADRLFEDDQSDLGARVLNCAILFARGKLRLDYVGLLLSDSKCKERVNQNTPNKLRRLVMVSLGVSDPEHLVMESFADLESEA